MNPKLRLFTATLFLICLTLSALVAQDAEPTPTAAPTLKETPKIKMDQTFLRIINATRPQIDQVWKSGLDLKMGDIVLAKDTRSGEGGGYAEVTGSLKGKIQIYRNSTGKLLISKDSELKKNTFNTLIIYGTLNDTEPAVKLIFYSADKDPEKKKTEEPEKEEEIKQKLGLLNCIDFFEVTISFDTGTALKVPYALWQDLALGFEPTSLRLSYQDEQERKMDVDQQLILNPTQEYWFILVPNPHLKAFHRPRLILIAESQARADALEPPLEEPEPETSPAPSTSAPP